jgi:hypothetical protein
MYGEPKTRGYTTTGEMTDEEADYWDEYYPKNPPKVDPARTADL